LRPFFGAKRATEIGTQILKDNLKLRQRNDNASATINKEITWLAAALRRQLIQMLHRLAPIWGKTAVEDRRRAVKPRI
jgi:hypothetical protein